MVDISGILRNQKEKTLAHRGDFFDFIDANNCNCARLFSFVSKRQEKDNQKDKTNDFWRTIRECNLLFNPYKHGSGHFATNLYKLYPQYFQKVNRTLHSDDEH